MPDQMTSVFGSDQAPHDLFARSRAEHAGAVANLQPLKSDYLCPHCEHPVMIIPGRPGFTCQGNSSHHWEDMEELKRLNPKQVAVAQRTVKQAGHVDVTVQIPGALVEQLNARYGKKLGATLAAVLRNLADEESLMVPSSDKAQIGIWLGAKIANSGELKGLVFNLMQMKNQVQAELTAVRTAVQELDDKGKNYVERLLKEMLRG